MVLRFHSGCKTVSYRIRGDHEILFSAHVDVSLPRGESERRRSVLLKVDGEVRSIAARDILYCEARRNDQRVSLADGSNVRSRVTTGELFAMLAPSGNCARCGAAYILNLAKLRRLNSKSALMADGVEIPVPRGAYAELKTAYYDFYSER